MEEEEEEGGVLEEENIKAAAQSAIQSWENGKARGCLQKLQRRGHAMVG